MRQLFLERADTSTPEFRKWFRDSKVVDDQGQPTVVYHATSSPADFDVFRQYQDIGHHFGSPKSAQDRLDWLAKDKLRPQGSPRYYPVYLSIQKPLELPDLDEWEPRRVMDILDDRGEISLQNPRDGQDMTTILTSPDKKRRTETLRSMLRRLGYDGVVYSNESEDVGSRSWIALDPGQIKSVFNRGTWDPRRGSIME